MLGSPFVAADLRAFAERCDVVTFDHEQVDLEHRGRAGGGRRRAPARCRDARARGRQGAHADRPRRGGRAGPGLPSSWTAGRTRPTAVDSFAAAHGWPVMLKAARGGYDGKGVWPVARPGRGRGRPGAGDGPGRGRGAAAPRRRAGRPGGPPPLGLVGGLAGGRDGAGRTACAARCSCRDGWSPTWSEAASALGQKVAEIAGAVGVMAVELFWSGGRLLVNEVATRPHNSGHWTIEGAVTSQFENHLRAVLDLPLGSTAPQHPQVASVNIFGGADGEDPGTPARPGPGRRGRPRAPLWQGRPPGTQTGPRDGVR